MHESGIGSKKRVEVGELRARRQEVRVVRARSLDSLEKARVFGMTPGWKADENRVGSPHTGFGMLV